MTWAFVTILFAIPLAQVVVELRNGQAPGLLAIAEPIRGALRNALSGNWRVAGSALAPMVNRGYFKLFEQKLEDASVPKLFVQPRLQEWVTRWGGFGNDKCTLGQAHWLFYQPGIDYITGPDFLDSQQILAATKRMVDKTSEESPSPDPRPAIFRLNEDCRRRGVRLIVMPAPDKASLQADMLTVRIRGQRTPRPADNRGYEAFLGQMRAHGVDVFDARPLRLQSGEIRYLAQDTHWTPEFMRIVAQGLAQHLAGDLGVARQPGVQFVLRSQKVQCLGDLVDMLGLTPQQSIYAPETTTIQQVLDAGSRSPWIPDQTADILLLGDSYMNIYSQPAMGWGTAAGFAEHLSYSLGRRLDVIAQNGAGVVGVRTELARIANSPRMRPKTIVVYEFAARDLLGSNWKVIPLPPGTAVTAPRTPPLTTGNSAPHLIQETATAQPPPSPRQSGPNEPGLRVTGRIVKTSTVPKPGSAPYADCLVFMKIEVEHVESGTYSGREMIIVFWGMKANVWEPAAQYTVGQRLRLKLVPFKDTESSIRSMQRADETDDYELQPYFALEQSVVN